MDAKYSADEVRTASLSYFDGDALAAETFVSKYALRDQKTGLFAEQTPADMHDRLAEEFARIEKKYRNSSSQQEIRNAIDHFSYIVPQGSPMFGIGNHYVNVSLSNCVVVESPEDNISGIMERGQELANLFKRRCGVGIDISTLRPDGTPVSNSAGTSTGAWSFADYYSNVCRMIGQNGRRGALMITLDVRHPDIEKFALMKRDLTKVTGANVSVKLSDDFMKAVEDGSEWVTRWPLAGKVKFTKTYDARTLWRTICESATIAAEPGLIFWDNYTNNLPAHEYENFKTVTVNPCSEIGLSAYDSCRLISINLKNFVQAPFTDDAYFDFPKFKKMVSLATRMSDDLVELEIEALKKIIKLTDGDAETELWSKLLTAASEGRRTGLGTHGLADALAALRVRYDESEGIAATDQIYETFRNTAYDESVNLAEERGPFPAFNWETEKGNAFIKRLPKSLRDRMKESGRRNISLLTMAPTGSVSILSQTSSGIEPPFRLSYLRRRKINPSDAITRVDYTDAMGDKWLEYEVWHQNVTDYWKQKSPEKIIEGLPDYFVTSDQIEPMQRVEIQSTIQQYIDHGISSTINLPKGTTVETVQKIYEASHKKGLKGVTVYVDGSRSGVLVEKKQEKKVEGIVDVHAPKRPELLPCEIHHATVNGQKWTILVGSLDGRPYETFGGPSENIHLPKKFSEGKILKRKCAKANAKGRLSCYDLIIGEGDDALVVKDIGVVFSPDDENYGVITRQISLSMRHGIPIQYIVEQLGRDIEASLFSFSKVMARVLKKYVKEGVESGETCVKCSMKLVFEDGCFICKNCGASKCS